MQLFDDNYQSKIVFITCTEYLSEAVTVTITTYMFLIKQAIRVPPLGYTGQPDVASKRLSLTKYRQKGTI